MVFPVCTFHCLTLNFVYAQIRLLGVEPMFIVSKIMVRRWKSMEKSVFLQLSTTESLA